MLQLRGRQQRLVEERDVLAGQITVLQGRQGAIAVELSRLDALLELYEPAPPGSPILPSPKPVGEKASPTSTPPPEGILQAEMPTTPPPVPPEGAWRAEAIRLLEDHGGPLHYKDLYRALANHGFPFGGRNPQAVLLTGLSREKDTFAAVGKGCYWITGREIPADADLPASPRATTQSARPRPIGRASGRSRK